MTVFVHEVNHLGTQKLEQSLPKVAFIGAQAILIVVFAVQQIIVRLIKVCSKSLKNGATEILPPSDVHPQLSAKITLSPATRAPSIKTQ